jgi:hypothetical protein
MCRSNFDRQSGPFALCLGALSATARPSEALWRRLLARFYALWARLVGLARAKL